MNYKTMHNPAKLLARTCTFACILFIGISCKDTDDFFEKEKGSGTKSEANYFDFSTTQEVDLIVDYSDFQANIPVFFSVYRENPIKNENQLGEYIDENIKPLFEGYTGKDGKFDETITLPTYATALHVVTGNFLVGLRRNVTSVENGQARVIVEDPLPKNNRRNVRSLVPGAGTSTDDLSTMGHLYKRSNGTQVYKPWATPLGTWNSASGRPDYLLDTSNPEFIAKGLVFSDEEINGMFGTACDALNSGTNLKEQYRAAADLRVVQASEISITALGSSTCWNSSLGYYFYDESNPPQSKMDLNIIMLFPNTQDGMWPRGGYPNNNYQGNIGAVRGDVIQLKYYPNIANGDFSGETTIFPAGTKIGFILKTNAWGQRGKDYTIIGGGTWNKAQNIWASSTEGLSFAPDGGKCPNLNGEARSAKFAYTAPNGNQYVVVSFEDACDDKDYDDLMFALNPANAFDFGNVAHIESRRSTVEGVYGFEDKWPEEGDYDMNDLMIDCKHELEWYTHPDGSKKLNKERFYLTTYHNYITLQDGLAVDLQASDIQTIYVNKILPGETAFASESYKMVDKKYYYIPEIGWDKNESRMWYLTDDITKNEDKTTGEGVTWVFEVTYSKAVSKGQCTIRPFLWRKLNNGKQLEVHLPWNSPTGKADTSLFGTKADRSDPSVTKSNGQKMYYVGSGSFPFAFYLEGVSIDAFKETTLKLNNESKRIDEFFPDFLNWSISEGKQNSDWYLKHISSLSE